MFHFVEDERKFVSNWLKQNRTKEDTILNGNCYRQKVSWFEANDIEKMPLYWQTRLLKLTEKIVNVLFVITYCFISLCIRRIQPQGINVGS